MTSRKTRRRVQPFPLPPIEEGSMNIPHHPDHLECLAWGKLKCGAGILYQAVGKVPAASRTKVLEMMGMVERVLGKDGMAAAIGKRVGCQ